MLQEKPAEQKSRMDSDNSTSEYDFSRCKLCAANTASPKYKLKKTTVYVCATCDFHFINHLDNLSSATQSDETEPLDRKAWAYIESRLPASEKQLRENLLLVKRYVSLPGVNCLDIGAGAGLFAHILIDAGAQVQGIEPQGIFREFAQRKFGITLKGETIDAPYWQQDFTGFFNIVTLWDVFEHVNFPAETLQNTHKVIKPGGLLFLDTPRRDALFYRISEWSYRLSGGDNPLFLESIYSPMPFRHKHIFTLAQLLKLLDKTGFSVEHMKSSFLQQQNRIVLVCRKP